MDTTLVIHLVRLGITMGLLVFSSFPIRCSFYFARVIRCRHFSLRLVRMQSSCRRLLRAPGRDGWATRCFLCPVVDVSMLYVLGVIVRLACGGARICTRDSIYEIEHSF